MEPLNDELGGLFGQALLAIARVDGEINPEEAALLRELVAKRTSVAIDEEAAFFTKLTPDALAAALRPKGEAYRTDAKTVDSRQFGRALVSDAVALAGVDGDLNSIEAHAILRYANALGCTAADVGAETRELDEWLSMLH